MVRIVDFIARHFTFFFSTDTLLLNGFIADLAVTNMTALLALMTSTRKELITVFSIANWDWISALLSWLVEQF